MSGVSIQYKKIKVTNGNIPLKKERRKNAQMSKQNNFFKIFDETLIAHLKNNLQLYTFKLETGT